MENSPSKSRAFSLTLVTDDRGAAVDHDGDVVILFGRYQAIPRARRLFSGSEPIEIGSRAFDLLMLLIEARGAIVGSDTIIRRVWPDTFIEDSNVRVQISKLRAALGSDRDIVKTVSGRGYLITTGVEIARIDHGALSVSPSTRYRWAAAQTTYPTAEASPGSEMASKRPDTNLPVPLGGLIGRENALIDLLEHIGRGRLTTVFGTGGMGKTRLAIELGWQAIRRFPDGVWLVDLASVIDPALVVTATATALGVAVSGAEEAVEAILAAIRTQRRLLIFDNCEHLVTAAAVLIETLLQRAPDLTVVATSQERLRIAAEVTYSLNPLALPPVGETEIARFGAIMFFVERAVAADRRFRLTADNAATVAEICRRLDGIPLALALGAARLPLLGLEGVRTGLNERLRMLNLSSSQIDSRHGTLRGMLEWSHDLLDPADRQVFRRLGIFVGSFSLDAAIEVAGDAGAERWDIIDALGRLIDKSLVTTEGSDPPRYRLLETLRLFARERLVANDDFRAVASAHADYHRRMFERAGPEVKKRPQAWCLAEFGYAMDDARSALDWAFSNDGDPELGIAMTLASRAVWYGLSLFNEQIRQLERALACFVPGATFDRRSEMRLNVDLGTAFITSRPQEVESATYFERAEAIAAELGEVEFQLSSLSNLFGFHLNRGGFDDALVTARRFCTLAAETGHPVEAIIGNRMIGTTLHYQGDQVGARAHLEEVLKGCAAVEASQAPTPYELGTVNERIGAEALLVRVLWLNGFPERAQRAAASVIAFAEVYGSPLALCYVLSEAACNLQLLTGDLASLEMTLSRLENLGQRHGLQQWVIEGAALRGQLLIRQGRQADGVAILRSTYDELRMSTVGRRTITWVGVMPGGLDRAEEVAAGLLSIEEALGGPSPDEVSWRQPELSRIEGEIALLLSADPTKAEACFRRAIEQADRLDALSWQLRAATSLSRLLHRPEPLAGVYARFTEGFETADLRAAKALLERL